MRKRKEEWKDIVGYEGLYQVSNLGNVKNVKYGKNFTMDQTFIGSDNYYIVKLKKNGHSRTHFVHNLVADAFLTKENNKCDLMHINGVTTDNRLSNLMYVHYFSSDNKKRKKVIVIKDNNTKVIKDVFSDINELLSKVKLNKKHISNIGKLPVIINDIRITNHNPKIISNIEY